MPATLRLDPDELLTTTRAVRKRLDLERPVPIELVRECLEVALQAPTGSNAQGWHFVVVRDAAKRKRLAEIYQRAWGEYPAMPFSVLNVHKDDPSMAPLQQRIASSGDHLAANLDRVPVHVIPCLAGRFENIPGPMATLAQASMYGSILPATWSFMLAARARGLGTCWTSLHLWYEEEAAEVLGIPYAEITQCALIPVAFTKGTDFKPGPRRPLDRVLHVDRW